MEIFGNDRHKIIHGDALHALSQVADNSVDLIFADPPYNIGKNFNGHKDKWATEEDYLNWCYKWLDLCVQKLSPTGSFYVMTATQFMPFFDIYLRKKLDILSRIVWSYDRASPRYENPCPINKLAYSKYSYLYRVIYILNIYQMLTENKIKSQKILDEATRLMNNAHKELQKADKNGKVYRDVKHVRLACGAAYLSVLKAIDGLFLLRNIPKAKRHASIEYYQHSLTQVDKKILHSLNVAYRILHIDGYYEGFNDIVTIKHGFEEAQYIINKLKSAI